MNIPRVALSYGTCVRTRNIKTLLAHRAASFQKMTIENMNQSEGLSELQSLQIKANSVVDESLESTRRMIAMCEEVRLHS